MINVKISKEQLQNYDANTIDWNNKCTPQHAVDYDGDGDLDLVTGCKNTSFFVFINSVNDPSKPPTFDTPAERLAIEFPEGHSDPHLYDWDGDGDLDLLTGGGRGSVHLSINEGTRQKPAWSDFIRLIRGSTNYFQTTDDGEKVELGQVSRVWVADHNQDGLPDLIVGDQVTLANKVAGLTQAETDRLKVVRNKLNPLHEQMNMIQSEYHEQLKTVSGEHEIEKLTQLAVKKLEPVLEQVRPLELEQSKLIVERKTGHVWVYLQQETSESPPSTEHTISSTESEQRPDAGALR